MNPLQAAMLAAEAFVMASLVLALFRSRTVLGLSPLYIVIGGFQYLEASLSLRVDVAPGWIVYPASMVMYTATLLAMLLVYIKEDTREARKLVYGLVLANAGLSVIAMLVSQHTLLSGTEVTAAVSTAVLRGSAWVALVGTVLLPIDLVGLILVYEFVSGYTRSLFVRAAVALLAIVAVDNFLFILSVHWNNPELPMLMVAGLAGKSAAALFYALMLTAYLKYADPVTATLGTGDVADVLQKLTYRQLYEQARTRMTRDALTDVYNRGYFDEAITRAIAQADRYQHPVSVMLVDCDHFKAINDTHSHLVGDKALRLIAETLREHARAADTVCRFGGDEFAVILSSADATSAAAFAERFRRRLHDRASSTVPELGTAGITATVGIATFLEDIDAHTAEDLLRLADHRLYAGKRAGRDRVVWRDVPATP
ncbi:MAG: GGDEF domain-containing protein [Vicinamibacterales bacterium]